MDDKQQLVELLRNAGGAIGYAPMEDEPDYAGFLAENGLRMPEAIIPAEKDLVPSELARRFKGAFPSGAAVFIPGRRFDRHGTRHGRGAGWYDRFLSEVPAEWLRVGVLRPSLLHEKLERKSWDQPVHFLLIQTEDGFEAHDTRGG